jgi:hypothetical protein
MNRIKYHPINFVAFESLYEVFLGYLDGNKFFRCKETI